MIPLLKTILQSALSVSDNSFQHFCRLRCQETSNTANCQLYGVLLRKRNIFRNWRRLYLDKHTRLHFYNSFVYFEWFIFFIYTYSIQKCFIMPQKITAQKITNGYVEKYFFCVEKNKRLRRKIFFLRRKK